MNKFIFLVLMVFSSTTFANVCGTDFQNFNPTTNGLDFVTVQSSETLKPCIINMGFFVNYAVNSLTYSKTLNASFPSGQKREDEILGADLSMGFGLTDRWDIGVNFPIILSQDVEDNYYVSSFDEKGITEVKVNSKYHLMGNEKGGLAAIVSFNKNLIENNPFTGDDPGLTWNFELAADKTLSSKWAVGVNAGYRLRDSGNPIAGVPFVPMRNQWIYSVAGSYLMASIDTKVIFEMYGSSAVNSEDQDTDRSMNSLEALVGLKHDYSQNIAMHFGMAKQIDNSLGGAEWRTYAGINWAIGPVCKDDAPEVIPVPGPEPVVLAQEVEANVAVAPLAVPAPAKEEVYQLNTEVFFDVNSDQVNEEKIATLNTFFEKIVEQKFTKLVIEGHTDSLGPVAYNNDLSERRAKTVKQILISKYKVSDKKVEAAGFGPSQPIADNGNYQGRKKNRRVEFKIWH